MNVVLRGGPIGLVMMIFLFVVLGTVFASAEDVKMPTFTTQVDTPPTVFMPPVEGANSLVAFGGKCMSQDEFIAYAESAVLGPILLGKIPTTDSKYTLFADAKHQMHVFIVVDPNRVCEIGVVTDLIFFDNNGNPVRLPE